MNWIERKAEKEKAIQAGGPDLWQNLTLTIKEVCESFNSRYGHEYSHVSVKPEGPTRIRVSRDVVKNVGPSQSRVESVSLQIAYEPNKFQIIAVCPTVKVAANVGLDFNEEEVVTPFLSRNGERISDDQASEILLSEFLFNAKFLVA